MYNEIKKFWNPILKLKCDSYFIQNMYVRIKVIYLSIHFFIILQYSSHDLSFIDLTKVNMSKLFNFLQLF